MVECAGLEIQYTFMRIEGSNPSLSAKNYEYMRPPGRFFFSTPKTSCTQIPREVNHYGVSRVSPPIYGRNAAGTSTLPSAC